MSDHEAIDRAASAGDFATARSMLEELVRGDPSNTVLWVKLAGMRNATGDIDGALEAIDRGLALSPLDYVALLHRAYLLERQGSPHAGEYFGRALAHAPAEGELPEPMKFPIAHARQRWKAHQDKVEAGLSQILDANLNAQQSRRAQRFISNVSRRTRQYHQEPTEFHYPELPVVEFPDPSLFPGLDRLEANTAAIRAEFEAVVADQAAELVPYIQYPETVPLAQWKDLNQDRKWTAIHLLRNGERVEANARHCPRTLELLEALGQPKIPGASPNAMFSLLAPRTKIPPHTGVANTRVVAHLPLIVPPGCGFRCGATVREWTVGEAFVFDDTIEHEAWNDSSELRVVLIFDLWAPSLDAGERQLVTSFISKMGVSFGGAI